MPTGRSSSPEFPPVSGIAEARGLQEAMRDEVECRDRLPEVRRVAGLDISFDRGESTLFAAAVVFDVGRREIVDVSRARCAASFPYVPGYLSFREIPPLLQALKGLRTPPDLLICDGHGRAHPRRFGLACHLGVTLDRPAIGCAKGVLVGAHRMPAERRGSRTRLLDGDEVIGTALRTRDGVKPVYVSIGHRVSLATAERWILRLAPRYRLPEPIRAAHAEVNEMRRDAAPRGSPRCL